MQTQSHNAGTARKGSDNVYVLLCIWEAILLFVLWAFRWHPHLHEFRVASSLMMKCWVRLRLDLL